jgi:hypothetical protein
MAATTARKAVQFISDEAQCSPEGKAAIKDIVVNPNVGLSSGVPPSFLRNNMAAQH